MAGDRDRTPSQSRREQLREFRRIVAAAVGELRSQEVRNTFASISLEELADRHIERLEASDNPLHPSRLERLRRVRDDLTNTIEEMKNTPPELFRRHDPDNDANTSPDTEES